MATHSSVLAWRIPGTAGPGGLPFMGSHRVGHDWSKGRDKNKKTLPLRTETRLHTQSYVKEICSWALLSPHTAQAGHYLKVYKCWRGCGEKGILLFCWWESKSVQPWWRTEWRFPKKLKTELPYDPAISLLGVYPKKTPTQKHARTPMFIEALFTIAKAWMQPMYPSTDEGIKKM